MESHISCDKEALDFDFIYQYLHNHAYWCLGIPEDVVKKSIQHSLCFGVYLESKQIGFARVISDYATFAYLGDVFIDPACRGNGYSKQLMDAVTQHPDLQGLRRFSLNTADAHSLYEQYGFTSLNAPDRGMEIVDPDIYRNQTKSDF